MVPEPSVRLERLLAEVAALPQVEVGVEVSLQHGVYLRQGWIKAGTVAVGECLREAVPIVLLQGEGLLAGSDGTIHITAPYAGVNAPGTRRAFYAITDCYLLNAVFAPGQSIAQVEQRITGERLCGSQSQGLPLPE